MIVHHPVRWSVKGKQKKPQTFGILFNLSRLSIL